MNTKIIGQRIYDIVVEGVDGLYPQFMKRVNNIDIDYFEDITRDSEELPKELNFELREKVLDDIRQFAMQLLDGSNIRGRVADIIQKVDADDRQQVLALAKRQLRGYVYASSLLNGGSDYTEDDLQQMYADAKKRNLWELLTRNNKQDVIEFHHALMDKTYEQCKDVLYESVDAFLSKLQEV